MNTGFQHKKRRCETWTFQKECSDLIPSFKMVEARGIEPLSENRSPWLSPSAECLLRFPSPDAGKQASGYSSCQVMTRAAALPRSRAPLIDALSPPAVLRGKTAAYLGRESNSIVVVCFEVRIL